MRTASAARSTGLLVSIRINSRAGQAGRAVPTRRLRAARVPLRIEVARVPFATCEKLLSVTRIADEIIYVLGIDDRANMRLLEGSIAYHERKLAEERSKRP